MNKEEIINELNYLEKEYHKLLNRYFNIGKIWFNKRNDILAKIYAIQERVKELHNEYANMPAV